MDSPKWDAVIVGGGVAGLSAAQMLGRARRRTLVIDAAQPRNRFSAHMHGVLGHDGIDPGELLEKGRTEARRYGVTIENGAVTSIVDLGSQLRITRADGTIDTTRAVVLAAGVIDELPDVPGLAQRWGRDVLHCPYCHGFEVVDSRLGVLATSPASLHQIELARQWSDDVTAFTAAAEPLEEDVRARLVARGIRIVDALVERLEVVDDALAAVVTADGRRHEIDALFTAPLPRLSLGFAEALGLARSDSPGSPLAVDGSGATSHPRVWAAGNLTAPHGNVPMAMGSGSMAGAGANARLVADDTARAVADRSAERNARWEQRYADIDRVWSGRVNKTTAAVVTELTAGHVGGSVLEIGCGEGADAVWMAERGWTVTAVDVSRTAVDRARAAARERGIQIDFASVDAAGDLPTGPFDLVVSSFLHSWEPDFPRIAILRDALTRVAPGGRMLAVSHAALPPWKQDAPEHLPLLRTPTEELALLGLDADDWVIELAELRARDLHGPDGTPAVIDDGVLLVRRR
ncbi:MAG: methyltransferase domain-containing protein [Microbacterium sp.]|uniref:methyltransferase domain-containing protein n=1 Tax=Microbacterium sp. TaxID=51671 RepID=UPI001AC48C63|nr:methyltransferase domain-containing protein [Microbacterium sp.]MBN9178114.1 methyltransferase domain-containing protein [Microbacterium sp.]